MKVFTLKNFLGTAMLVLLLMACGPKTKKITVSNVMPLKLEMGTIQIGDGLEFKKLFAEVYWDVAVVLNGVDFGIVEGGKKSATLDVNDANNLKIEKFEVQKNEKGQSFYVIQNGERNYFHWDDAFVKQWKSHSNAEKDLVKIEKEIKKIDQAGGLLNSEYTLDVSYGYNGDIQAVKWRAEEAKKKKEEQKNSNSKKSSEDTKKKDKSKKDSSKKKKKKK